MRQWRRAIVATPGEWQCKTGGVRRLAVANVPNIFQMIRSKSVLSMSHCKYKWLGLQHADYKAITTGRRLSHRFFIYKAYFERKQIVA